MSHMSQISHMGHMSHMTTTARANPYTPSASVPLPSITVQGRLDRLRDSLRRGTGSTPWW